jgi:hypothetical protein
MTIELFLSIAGFVAVLIGGAWALVSIVVRQFEARLKERFDSIEKARVEGATQWQANFDQLLRARQEEEKQWRQVERDLNALRIELPKEYVRREDHIRFETVINAKLDSVAKSIEVLTLKVKIRAEG